MQFKTYQQAAWTTNQTSEDDQYLHMELGFSAESANIGSLVKEARREQSSTGHVAINRKTLLDEIGDTLWYLGALHTLRQRDLGMTLPVDSFDALDQWAQNCDGQTQIDVTRAMHKSRTELCYHLNQDKEFPVEICAQYLCDLARFASICGVTLTEAAEVNLKKVHGRYSELNQDQWPRTALADLGKVIFCFEENNGQVTMKINDTPVGDPLTSQVEEDDKFKYHDALHLSLATILGWSPVIRRLMDKKRADELDGQRHVFIEESLLLGIWRNFQETPENGGTSWVILTDIYTKLDAHPEASKIPPNEWEHAIKRGIQITQELIANKGGFVECDFTNRKIEYIFPSR